MTEQRPTHKYEVGEEVVVRLEAGGVFEVAAGDFAVIPLPAWTIAEIVSRNALNGVPQYRLTFVWGEATYKCTVSESAMEGIA